MTSRDRELGMQRRISRRDLLQGAGAVAAASFVPGQAFAEQMLALEESGSSLVYPPALTGMRGSHDGSFEVAHQLARENRQDWGAVSEPDSDVYDLVVVGAGISGLSAAQFFLQSKPDARILILDNHDDFGGHAKRNEFNVGGRQLIGYGGSQTLENPSSYSAAVKSLLENLGVDVDRFTDAYDWGFHKRHGLGGGIFFDKKNWGSDRLVRCEIGNLLSYLPLAPSTLSPAEAVAAMPLSDAARTELLRVMTVDENLLGGLSEDEREELIYTISYRDFIADYLGVTEEEVFRTLQYFTADSALGIEATSVGEAMSYNGLPGRKSIGMSDREGDPYIHHFPDGNASVARMLVRKMIPAVAPGSTMEDIVTARFDYGKLDVAGSQVRLRLNSTAVHVEHAGSKGSARNVHVTYVQNGQAAQVKAKHTILACYNNIIPALCPELPEEQRAALGMQVKSPILYSSVALKNWRAFEQLGIGAVFATSGYHLNALLDFPVSLGDYSYTAGPDEPVVVHMEKFLHSPNANLAPRDQLRVGRHELYATSFETIERNIREQLAGMLSETDFDPARDISGITVNRWSHGYSDGFYYEGDPWYGPRGSKNWPYVIGRQPHGQIAIANSDAGANAMFDTAVGEAWRAVNELV